MQCRSHFSFVCTTATVVAFGMASRAVQAAEWTEVMHRNVGHDVSQLCIMPTGETLIFTGRDSGGIKTLRVDATSKPVTVADGETRFASLSLSEDGKVLAAATEDGHEIKVFSTNDWQEIPLPKNLLKLKRRVTSVVLSPSATYLCFVADGDLGLIDMKDKKLLFYERRIDRANRSIARVEATDHWFWIGTDEGIVRRLDCTERTIRDLGVVAEQPLIALAETGSGKVVSTNYDREMAILDVRANTLEVIEAPQIEFMRYTGQGDMVVCGATRKMIIFDVATKRIWTLIELGLWASTTCVAVAREKGIVAAATPDGDVLVGRITK